MRHGARSLLCVQDKPSAPPRLLPRTAHHRSVPPLSSVPRPGSPGVQLGGQNLPRGHSPRSMAGMNNGALAIAGDYRRRGGGGGGFFRLRNRHHRAGLYLAAWGGAGILSTTVHGGLAVNPDHVMFYFIVLMAGVLLLLLSLVDLPWGDRAAARLEGLLGAVL
ncbi:unnamed protein product [Urochloa decumbens]|uniref:Uncharacterized protein n=2 Tax=Urochloa decumbens TaxID=240449 RepID=A0ABC8VFG9_9POAL